MNRTLFLSLILLGLGTGLSCDSKTHEETSRPSVSNSEEFAKAPAVVNESTVVLLNEDKVPSCTGTLVAGKTDKFGKSDELFVFTARHCIVKVNDDESLSPIFAIPALVLDPSIEFTVSGALPLNATAMAFHAIKDIAVIRVEPYDESKAPQYKPIALAPSQLILNVGQEGIIAGYGKTADSFSSGGPSEPTLLRWGKMQYKQEGEDGEGGTQTIEYTSSTSSTCSGDSGGPLYTETDTGWVLLGVISNSQWPCHKKFLAEFLDVRKLGEAAKSALRGEKISEWTVAAFPTPTP